jgi:hypothetical protein
MSHFQVIGYNPVTGNEVYGEVMGDMDGDMDGDIDGEMEGEIMGAAARARRRAVVRASPQRMMQLKPKPGWRSQLAPGVIQPDEGMVPLPLTGNAGSPAGTFTLGTTQITFSGQLQKPFRAERLLVSVVRTGTDAVGRLLTQFFVGTDLQGAEISGWDAELIGGQGAFGTRLTAKAAEPGVQIRMVVTLSSALTITTSSIFASMTWLGRIVH